MALVLVALLLLGLMYMYDPFGDPEEGEFASYRTANAMYIYNALERQRVAAMSYYDQHGALPGDSTDMAVVEGREIRGNGNGRIEAYNLESEKFFVDLFKAGVNPVETVRVRGKKLKILWTRLMGDGEELGVGHYFKMTGLDAQDAAAFDYKYDDARSGTGDAVFVTRTDGSVTMYVRFELFR